MGGLSGGASNTNTAPAGQGEFGGWKFHLQRRDPFPNGGGDTVSSPALQPSAMGTEFRNNVPLKALNCQNFCIFLSIFLPVPRLCDPQVVLVDPSTVVILGQPSLDYTARTMIGRGIWKQKQKTSIAPREHTHGADEAADTVQGDQGIAFIKHFGT